MLTVKIEDFDSKVKDSKNDITELSDNIKKENEDDPLKKALYKVVENGDHLEIYNYSNCFLDYKMELDDMFTLSEETEKKAEEKDLTKEQYRIAKKLDVLEQDPSYIRMLVKKYKREKEKERKLLQEERGKPDSKLVKQWKDGTLTASELYKRKLETAKKGAYRAYTNARRQINANITKDSKFLTLTFRDDVKANYDYCNNEFKKFIKRLNYYLKTNNLTDEKVKFTAVHELTKKGRIHFHVIFYNLPFLDVNKELAPIWRNGFIKINRIRVNEKDGIKHVGGYMCKYIAKQFLDKEFLDGDLDVIASHVKRRSYTCSKGLKKSKTFYIKKEEALAELLEKYKVNYTKDFQYKQTKYINGQITTVNNLITYSDYITKDE